MVKKKGASFLERKVSNRLSYTIIAAFALILVGVGVYAFGAVPSPVGHAVSQLQTCDSDGQVLKMSGGVWTCGTDSVGSSSPWLTSGSNIYYNTGNVGIGTTGPSYKLDISGGAARIHSSSGADSLIFSEGPYPNVYRTKFRQTDRGDDAVDFDIWASDGIDVDTLVASFSNPSNSPRAALTVNGDLFVSGKITVGTTPGACNQDSAGELRYLNGYCSGDGRKTSQLEACMRTHVTSYAWQIIKQINWPDSSCAAAPPENPDTYCDDPSLFDCKA